MPVQDDTPRGMTGGGVDPPSMPSIQDLVKQEQDRLRQDDPTPGRMRLDMLIQKAPGPAGSEERDKYILSLPDDPSDPSYNDALQAYKAGARERETERGNVSKIAQRKTATRRSGEGSFKNPTQEKIGQRRTFTAPENAAENDLLRGNEKRLDDQKAYRKDSEGKPIIKGVPVGAEQVLNQANDPSGNRDPFLDQFANNEDLSFDDQDRKVAVRSGDYVYVGQQDDPNGGPGYKRDTYVFADDAAASLGRMDPAKIKHYQAMMKNPQTGMLDPDLIQAWQTAVKIGQSYARAGMKVDLYFIFDTLMNTAMAGGGGGGGGGGGRFAGMSPSDIAVNYYMAMMQVAGDISGVNG